MVYCLCSAMLTNGFGGQVGVMTELFTLVRVGDVHLDKRDVDARQCVDERDGCMRPCAGVDDDELGAIGAGGMDAVQHHALVVGLERVKADSVSSTLLGRPCRHILQRICAVSEAQKKTSASSKRLLAPFPHPLLWLARPEQIQVRPVQQQNFRQRCSRHGKLHLGRAKMDEETQRKDLFDNRSYPFDSEHPTARAHQTDGRAVGFHFEVRRPNPVKKRGGSAVRTGHRAKMRASDGRSIHTLYSGREGALEAHICIQLGCHLSSSSSSSVTTVWQARRRHHTIPVG